MIAQTKTQAREFFVHLLTVDTDELGVPWGHDVAVSFDAGVTPDWERWLALYNADEDEPYQIAQIEEVTGLPEVEPEF